MKGINQLKSGKYRAQYTNKDVKRSKTFESYEDAVNQRLEWEKEHGAVIHGQTPNDLTGERYGKLTVIKYAGTRDGYGALWECQCDCGNTITARADHLKRGRLLSCGCYFKEYSKGVADRTNKLIKDKKVEGVHLDKYTTQPYSSNSTGYRGVSRYSDGRELYRARLEVNGKVYTMYGFLTAKSAYYNGRLVLEDEHLPDKN